jgi:hypothetical protein
VIYTTGAGKSGSEDSASMASEQGPKSKASEPLMPMNSAPAGFDAENILSPLSGITQAKVLSEESIVRGKVQPG